MSVFCISYCVKHSIKLSTLNNLPRMLGNTLMYFHISKSSKTLLKMVLRKHFLSELSTPKVLMSDSLDALGLCSSRELHFLLTRRLAGVLKFLRTGQLELDRE